MKQDRTYFIMCTVCGGRKFRLTQLLSVDVGDDEMENDIWKKEELYKSFSHDGWGWELDNFVQECTKCNSKNKTKVCWRR